MSDPLGLPDPIPVATPLGQATGGELRGSRTRRLTRPRGLWGVKLGPANRGRRLDAEERRAIEQKMRDEGRL
jgi:hypothetical protein